jgi:dTDP-4-dehydrorhamnose reductase
MDLADERSVDAALRDVKPWGVVNTAGYVRVDDAERDQAGCYRDNTLAAATLARATGRRGIPLVTFSTDLVFDGAKPAPYVESDPVAPLNVYGRSKAEAERLVLDANARALVVRTSAFFGPWDPYNLVTLALDALAAGEAFEASADITVTATYVADLVHAALDLLIDAEAGIWHLANAGSVTWFELARRAAEAAELDPRRLQPASADALGWTAPRPRQSALATERGWIMPALDDALARYAEARPVKDRRIPERARGGA